MCPNVSLKAIIHFMRIGKEGHLIDKTISWKNADQFQKMQNGECSILPDDRNNNNDNNNNLHYLYFLY